MISTAPTTPKHTPLVERPHNIKPGIHRLYRFDNGYGASVVRFSLPGLDGYGSYTSNEKEWEVAVVRWKDRKMNRFDLVYDTPITDDVLGHVHDDDLDELLDSIEALPAAEGTMP